LAAGIERKLDVPEAGDFESVLLCVACQCAPVADLLMQFVDGHGWLVSVDSVNILTRCGSATRKSPPAKNNPQAGELAANTTAIAAGCQGRYP
jgi:hypothetical protein